MNKFKDKLYELQGNNTPIINKIPSRHTRKNPLLYFDEEKGHNRELRYATNQKSIFVDEQKKIVSIMTSINKFIENKAIKLKKIQDLKKSIMQDLLTGKVKVKVN